MIFIVYSNFDNFYFYFMFLFLFFFTINFFIYLIFFFLKKNFFFFFFPKIFHLKELDVLLKIWRLVI